MPYTIFIAIDFVVSNRVFKKNTTTTGYICFIYTLIHVNVFVNVIRVCVYVCGCVLCSICTNKRTHTDKNKQFSSFDG